MAEPTGTESLGSEVLGQVPRWARGEGFADNPRALAGARVFAESGCLACHTYLRTGSANLGARDLSRVGRGPKGVTFFRAYVANPSKFGNRVMPRFGPLGRRQLTDLAVFLEASKGPR